MSNNTYPNDLLGELARILGLVSHYMEQLVKERKQLFGIPLSVELRKLYSQGTGNRLLERVQDQLGIKLRYKATHKPPDQYKEVEVKEYIDGLAFVSNGKAYTRIQVIKHIADQRGAHTDDNLKELHAISPGILLPWKNPAKTKLMLSQDLHQIMQIADKTLWVADKQLRQFLPFQ